MGGFSPKRVEYTHYCQIFGEEEKIYGYKGLSIDVRGSRPFRVEVLCSIADALRVWRPDSVHVSNMEQTASVGIDRG